MRIAWVIGSGGLLGAAMCRTLLSRGDTLFFSSERFFWTDPARLTGQLESAVEQFACRIASADQWEIYWAAGAGTMNSSEDQLCGETDALAALLELLTNFPELQRIRGSIGFSSSAGAIYAGSQDEIITEASVVAPTSAYAREKLRQEALVQRFTADNGLRPSLIARISTIYGPGQAVNKAQGLLTFIARSVLEGKPIQIYVPFDTIRDYIAADDAAAAIVNALRSAASCEGSVIKIIASERPATIAEIISIFKRVARRAPRIVTSASSKAAVYSRRVVFRSTVLIEPGARSSTSLLVGIAQLLRAERRRFVQRNF